MARFDAQQAAWHVAMDADGIRHLKLALAQPGDVN